MKRALSGGVGSAAATLAASGSHGARCTVGRGPSHLLSATSCRGSCRTMALQQRGIATSTIASYPSTSMSRQAPLEPQTHLNSKVSSPEDKLPPPNPPPRRTSSKARIQPQPASTAAQANGARIGSGGKEKAPTTETAPAAREEQQVSEAAAKENAPTPTSSRAGPPAALQRFSSKQASEVPEEAKQEVPAGPPKPTLKERAMKLYETAKYLFKFYLEGIKQIWRDREMVSKLRARVKEREEKGLGGIRWVESQMIQTHRANMRKLPLFVAILLILEEVLPLVVIYAPSLLPSTCVLPSQLAKMRSEEERRRANAVKALASDEQVRKVVDATMKSDTKVQPSSAQEGQAVVPLTTLASLNRNTLASVADLFALNHWGRPKSLIVSSIEKHMAYLRKDDVMLLSALESRGQETFASPVDEETSWAKLRDSDWLWKACSKRGLRSSEASSATMESNLITWLQVGRTEPPSDLGLALLPLALYDGTVEELVKLEGEFSEEHKKGLRQRTAEVVESVVEEERRRLGEPAGEKTTTTTEANEGKDLDKKA